MGLILTTLILTAPPMAAVFFQGTLGTFTAYSQIGGGAAATPSSDGRPPGSHQEQPASSYSAATSSTSGRATGFDGGDSSLAQQSETGKYGAAR
jgi:type IV secretion system protein VirB6